MAKDKPAKYWRFKLDTRRKFTELSQEIARINSGGGADIDLTDYATKVWVEAKGYITASALTPYALKTDIPSLVGYATEDFVNNKLVSYATTDSVTAIQNTLTGQIGAVDARVDSNDEQIAILNETTSGHTTSIGTLTQRVDSVEQLAATKLDSSYFTLANIKSTLGISDWALAATKPSYAWSEITSRPTALSQFTDDLAGKYLPLSKFQVAEVANPSTVYLQSGIYRQSDGSHLAVGTSGWSQFITLFAGGDNWAQMYFSYDGRLHYRTATFGNGDPANIPWTAIITEKNIGSYNAGSATKLLHRRKLWGNDFDGTEDVSGLMYVGNDFYIEHPTTGRQLSISPYWTILGYNNLFIGNPTYVDGRNVYIRYGNDEYISVFASNGNVGIGNTSPTERLDVSGNVKASGNINATSITINGVTITASNGSITVNGNVLATGAITAKVVG